MNLPIKNNNVNGMIDTCNTPTPNVYPVSGRGMDARAEVKPKIAASESDIPPNENDLSSIVDYEKITNKLKKLAKGQCWACTAMSQRYAKPANNGGETKSMSCKTVDTV